MQMGPRREVVVEHAHTYTGADKLTLKHLMIAIYVVWLGQTYSDKKSTFFSPLQVKIKHLQLY